MLVAQTGALSDAARDLVRKPKPGYAQLTLVDGRKEEGRILRVTDDFVSFRGRGRCEDIELAKIAKIRRLRTPGQPPADVEDYIGEAIMLGMLVPFASVSWAMEKLKSPPSWESGGGVGGRLKFNGLVVKGDVTLVKHGLYSVATDGLHLAFDNAPEKVIPYVRACEALVLDNPVGRLDLTEPPKHVSAPIVGRWGNRFYSLNLKPDSRFEERKEEVRSGTFERTASGLRIRWTDADGWGGREWTGRIEHRRVVVRIGPVVARFQYVNSG
jgi:hypothetical protein